MSVRRESVETVADHVRRLLADPLCFDATASELAALVGCSPGLVRQVQRLKLAFDHARALARQIDWPFDESALISLALEHYAQIVTRTAGGCTAVGASGAKGPDGTRRKAGATIGGRPRR
ncbi:MAG: hypothetical protein AAGF92_14605 [Myxococcota bacterium]